MDYYLRVYSLIENIVKFLKIRYELLIIKWIKRVIGNNWS